MAKTKKKGAHYLNNKEFEITIKNYLEDTEKYEDELVEKLDLLITNITLKTGSTLKRFKNTKTLESPIITGRLLLTIKKIVYLRKITFFSNSTFVGIN